MVPDARDCINGGTFPDNPLDDWGVVSSTKYKNLAILKASVEARANLVRGNLKSAQRILMHPGSIFVQELAPYDNISCDFKPL